MNATRHQRRPPVDKLVVVFDICSSSNIIEDLTKTSNLDKFQRLLKHMELFMQQSEATLRLNPYKFVGDGWILLFPTDVLGQSLFTFLNGLSKHFQTLFEDLKGRYLEKPPVISGLTFGIEKGSVKRVYMNGVEEFVGRPINIACRLQSTIKDKDGSPGYKALVSKQVFSDYFSAVEGLQAYAVTRTLRNINGGERYPCYKLSILPSKRRHRRIVKRIVRRDSAYHRDTDFSPF